MQSETQPRPSPNRSSSNRRSPTLILISIVIILQLLVIATAFIAGFLVHEWRYGAAITGNPGSSLPVLAEAYQLLKNNAYFPLPEEKALEYGMIRGMLQTYNEPFTIFLEPPQHELETQKLEGHYGGIGARLERDAQNLAYLYPVPDSPALKSGVQEGDRLLKVDGLVITAQTNDDQINAAIRGPIGQKVRIIIGRKPDYKPIELSVERADTALPSTTWNLAPDEPRVGVVHVQVIADTTPDEVSKAIKELQQNGASRFVIDVRNNGGGLVDAGVKFASLFLKNGKVIDEQYRGQPVKTYSVDQPGPFSDLPVVVLVNKGTASAAEIFAGALQGQKRAQIVGTRTYGKDTIQLVFNLSDGSSLHVTSAHWWVPGLSGKIGGNGLQPDVAVPENADPNAALQTAIEIVLK